MKSSAEILGQMDAPGEINIFKQPRLTERQKERLEQFYAMVDEWKAGHITLEQAKQQSVSGWLRFQFLLATPKNHAMRKPVLDLLEAIWRRDRGPGMMTRTGWLSAEMVESQGGRMEEVFDPETGLVELVANFPSEYGSGFDGKIDYTRPIFGKPPRLHPPDDPIRVVSRPAGYSEWYDTMPDWGDSPELDWLED